MKKLTLASLAAVLVAVTAPAIAKEDCDAGYKTFLGKMSIYVDTMSAYDLADAVRKSLDAYNSCKAGDELSLHGVWDKILADMQSKSGK